LPQGETGLGLCGLMWCRLARGIHRLRVGVLLRRVMGNRHPTIHNNSMHNIKKGSPNAQNNKHKNAFFEPYAQLPRSVEGVCLIKN
ncbi:hypothetical protein, partial [Enterobacter hormaechei]